MIQVYASELKPGDLLNSHRRSDNRITDVRAGAGRVWVTFLSGHRSNLRSAARVWIIEREKENQ